MVSLPEWLLTNAWLREVTNAPGASHKCKVLKSESSFGPSLKVWKHS